MTVKKMQALNSDFGNEKQLKKKYKPREVIFRTREL
jgi:hypothetical protein